MTENEKHTFEEIFKRNERRIYYQLHKLGIRDLDGEFYAEGLYAMWDAYKKYQPDKGPLSTYFNYTIRHRLIDLIRRKTTDLQNEESFIEKEISSAYSGNKYGDSKMPIIDSCDITLTDEKLWKQVFSLLTGNQRKWVFYHIIRDMPIKEIAEKEKVSVEAVKGWGKQVRKKLKVYFEDR